jgi:hypothetical protein
MEQVRRALELVQRRREDALAEIVKNQCNFDQIVSSAAL